MKEIYRIQTRPKALDFNVIQGEKYRITFLTEALVRLEYAEDGIFEDRATQFAFYRDFPKTDYRVVRTEEGIEVHTSRLHLKYNEKAFSANGLTIQVKGNLSNYFSMWRYGEVKVPDFLPKLRGTARTLDEADGAIPLESGIISFTGFEVIDDSKSHILLEDGWIEPRKKGVQDLYFFGYGHEYKEALRDFYYLSGNTPMLPRFALGNWWSRYYKYTEKTYNELMDRFEKEHIPFTVAVIDMDWHLVDIDPKYGSGWTGYTWNREFFPKPERFLKNLHDRGMRTTLNVHPADGVRGHEEMYVEMAKAMGVDYEKEDPVMCDVANPAYMEAYFKYLHHPKEAEGVDFWWIDWQQGNTSKIEGLDPLWIMNHYHTLDNKRNGKRSMIFSRYAGPGSHRYPVGFSGDTWITWESLDFQPYFTSSATNIGFGWWSHDIGGHMGGYKDDEMAARWAQYGLYSPILRLHSSNSEFNGKEPWRYKKEAGDVIADALRQRHQMIPYLYTMNYRAYKDSLPIVMPMYYEYPEERSAYEMKNQFLFGTELMVAPITRKRMDGLNVAEVHVWLPEGEWYDIYTGMMYEGDRELKMYRDLRSIPVLAKSGAILPMTDEIAGMEASKNPESLRLKVYPGAEGRFELYEDDNETCAYENGDCIKTLYTYKEVTDTESQNRSLTFTIEAAEGNLSLIPAKRSYIVEFAGMKNISEADGQIRVIAGNEEVEIKTSYDAGRQVLAIEIPETEVTKEIRICLDENLRTKDNKVVERCFDFLNQAEMRFFLKDEIYNLFLKEKRIPVLLAQLQKMEIGEDLLGVLTEFVTARS